MKPIPLLLTSASLILALSVVLPLLGVATEANASQPNLASSLLLAGVAILGSSFVLLARSRRSSKQLVVSHVRHLKKP